MKSPLALIVPVALLTGTSDHEHVAVMSCEVPSAYCAVAVNWCVGIARIPVTGLGIAEISSETKTAEVLAATAKDSPVVFPAASYADTAYVYVVLDDNPLSLNKLVADVLIFAPFLNILYPVTPTSSVDAVQLNEIELDVTAVAKRLVGTLGAVVSVLLPLFELPLPLPVFVLPPALELLLPPPPLHATKPNATTRQSTRHTMPFFILSSSFES